MEGHEVPEFEKTAAYFPAVRAVANGMIADFGLVSLCRYFKKGQHERFRECLHWLEALQKTSEQLQRDHRKKLTVCGFLARVVDGKEQDVQYDSDERITPLMSAIPLWDCLQDAVEDKALFDNIKKLLFIQAVAVYVERGDYVKAQWVLDWLKEEFSPSPNLKMKLSMILNMKDAYHTFLKTFSFVSLVENIKVFLDQFLEDHPSDFIFTAASKEARSCLEAQAGQMSSEDEKPSGNPKEPSRTVGASTSCQLKTRAKRTLFPKHNIFPWRPDSSKKPQSSHHTHFNMRGRDRTTCQPSKPQNSVNPSSRGPKKKWTYEEDRDLKSGVFRYGMGKWAKILQEFNFGDRTNVMLKDRWRTLQKQDKVGGRERARQLPGCSHQP